MGRGPAFQIFELNRKPLFLRGFGFKIPSHCQTEPCVNGWGGDMHSQSKSG